MSGRVERFSQVIPASGEIALAPGNFIFLESATLAVSIILQGRQAFQAANVTAGVLIGRVESWSRGAIRGTAGATVTWFYGDQAFREDVTDFRSQLIGGTTLVSEAPSAAITDAAAVALPNGATTAIVAANLARRRVTITNPSTALASFFIRTAGGANNLLEVPPGTFVELKTTAAVSGRNDSGGALSALVLEET